MTRDHVDDIRRESGLFRAALADCPPDAPVPGCPEWSAADLLWHLGRVQWFWASIVAARPATPGDLDVEEPPRPAAYPDLLAAFDRHSADLVDALTGADPADPAWSWWDDRTVGFALRRQAHEALVHRVDAEQTADRPLSGIDPALAADGVAEFLTVVFPSQAERTAFTGTGQHVLLAADDVPARVWVELGVHDELRVVADPGAEPDATLQGPAAHLDLWLWRRCEEAPRLTGRVAAYEHLLRSLRRMR